jgi:hypothetical protein
MRPATRKNWLAQNPLPPELRYYSLVTFPQPERISSILTSSYKKLARIDARNDSQMIFYDQVVPGSTLVGYVNADHWALAVPIARTHDTIGSLFVTQNAYPREALAAFCRGRPDAIQPLNRRLVDATPPYANGIGRCKSTARSIIQRPNTKQQTTREARETLRALPQSSGNCYRAV